MYHQTGSAFHEVIARQQHWAQRRRISLDSRYPEYVTRLEDNLVRALSSDTRTEYEEGGGHELDPQDNGRPPKLLALHSSDALLCNLFEYWRHQSTSLLARALNAAPGCNLLKFQQKRVINPAWRTPPHLDCELQGGTPATAVESKFTEPYNPERKPYTLHGVYAERQDLWGDLPHCGQLARRLHDNVDYFAILDAPQLLRHILGLLSFYRSPEDFRLIYLWYEVPDQEGDYHRREIERFRELVDARLNFESRTHQDVFRNLADSLKAHSEYRDYMVERYF